MKASTLRSRINRLTLYSLGLVILIAVSISVGYSYIKFNLTKIGIVETLRNSSSVQIQEILPTLVVSEQSGGLSLILERIKREESLSDIYFIEPKHINSEASKYIECKFSILART